MRGWWLALLFVLGCDGFGEPVVGRTRDDGPRLYMCQESMFDCMEVFQPLPPFLPPPPVSMDCPNVIPAACDAGQRSSCSLALRVVEGAPVTLPRLSCVTLDLTPALDNPQPELRELNVGNSRIVLHSERATTFRLPNVTLERVAIELQGPIALELSGQLANVSITSVDAVQVTIEHGTATDLKTNLPAGTLRVTDTRVSTSALHARELVLETVPVFEVRLRAERLVGIELKGERVQLDVGDLSMSELDLSRLELHHCNTALFVNARLTQSSFAPCSERLRLHSSAITTGRAFGTIESIDTLWTRSVLGSNVNTTAEMWGGTLSSSVLCGALKRLTVWRTSVVCVDCRQLREPEQHICLVSDEADLGGGRSDAGVDTSNDDCPLFDQGPPMCDPAPSPTSPL